MRVNKLILELEGDSYLNTTTGRKQSPYLLD